MGKMDEMIQVVKRDHLLEGNALWFQGVESDPVKIKRIVANMNTGLEVIRRGDAEENPTYKQPIPYLVLRQNGRLFLYKRLSGGGESRLFDKLSIGVGGHMNHLIDSAAGSDAPFMMEVTANMKRELHEELVLTQDNNMDFQVIGFINDDENEVGRVHIGVLLVGDLPDDATVSVRETDQLEGEWVHLADLRQAALYSKLENWSKLTLTAIS